MDELKLSMDTLKSVNKECDPEEEQIYRDLYMELEEIDRCVSRIRSKKGVTKKSLSSREGTLAQGGTRRCYVRRGTSGASTSSATPSPGDLREPIYDDEGNVVDEGYFGSVSHTSSSEHDSSSEFEPSSLPSQPSFLYCALTLVY